MCRQGLAHHPDLVTAKVALARLVMARGALDEATGLLSEAAGSSPEHADTFRALGQLLLEAGDNERARSILEYAEELAPADPRIAELLLAAGGSPVSSESPTVVSQSDELEKQAAVVRFPESSQSPATAEPSSLVDDEDEAQELDSSALEELDTPTPLPLPFASPPAAPVFQGPVVVAPPPPMAAPAAPAMGMPHTSPLPMPPPQLTAEAPPTAPNPSGPFDAPGSVTPFPIDISDENTPTFGEVPAGAPPAAVATGSLREGPMGGPTLEPEVLEESPLSGTGRLADFARPLPPPPPWSGATGYETGYESTPRMQPLVMGARGHQGAGALARAGGLWRSSSPGKRQALVTGGAALAVILLAVAFWPSDEPAPPGERASAPRAESSAPAAGGPAPEATEVRVLEPDLASLEQVLAETSAVAPSDAQAADALARRALAAAMAAADYGLATGAEADKAAKAAESEKTPSSARTARIEAARALLALAERRPADAEAAAKRALAADEQNPEALWAAGRAAAGAGDTTLAERQFAAALERAPGFRAAGFDRATALLDEGDQRQARTTLAAVLGETTPRLRERLLLAEMARAESVGTGTDLVGNACELEGNQSPVLSARCRLHEAVVARLEGRRGVALREVAALAPELKGDRRAAARAALLLAALGDIDAADELGQAASLTGSTALPAQWWAWAIALGRGTERPQNVPASPSGPEERLLAARLALEKGDAEGLTKTLIEFGQHAVSMDKDLEMFAALGQATPPAFVSELQRRSSNGNSFANYVLGRLFLARGDSAVAARHLADALGGHGDTCSVAKLLLGLPPNARPAPVSEPQEIVHALSGLNAACSGLGS